MDSEFYIKQTRDHYNVDAAQLVFMQDNVSVLVARIVKQWVMDNNINVLWWPVNSPNLNPIEHVWCTSGCSLVRLYPVEHLEHDYILNFYKSLPVLLAQVIKRIGRSTDY